MESKGRRIRLTLMDFLFEEIPRNYPTAVICSLAIFAFFICIFPLIYDEVAYWMRQRNTRSKAVKLRHEMIEAALEEKRTKEEETLMIKAAEKDEPKISKSVASKRDTEVAA